MAYDHLLKRVWSPGRRGQRWLLREAVKRNHRKLGEDAGGPRYSINEPMVGCLLGPAEPGEHTP